MLTAKGEEIDKVLGLEFGADDYMTKPFSVRELIARIKAILRRTENHTTENITIKIGKLSVDFKSFTALLNGNVEKMTHKEFEILRILYEMKTGIKP